MFEAHAHFSDKVIDSDVLMCVCDYGFALDGLFPLINRYDDQRKIQNKKFYERLRRDIVGGCVMPAITIAIVDNGFKFESLSAAKNYILKSVSEAYVLDGIQRLNTLNSARADDGFDRNLSMLLNIIISPSQDKLLYRMITLNNGQKPMSARHQIEILTKEMFSFKEYKNINMRSEKDSGEQIVHNAFKLSDVSKAYLSFITENLNNDNNKIIEQKMDEILVGRIFDVDIKSQTYQFSDFLDLIDNVCSVKDNLKWLRNENNLIGVAVGGKKSKLKVTDIAPEEFGEVVQKFEAAFEGFDVSKLNVGRYRREFVSKYFENYEEFKELDQAELLEYFFDQTAS